MKAKLYVFEGDFEIKLSNDEVIKPVDGENIDQFKNRVQEIVNNEYLDDEFELIEIDEEVVALNDAKTLKAALDGGATGLQKKLIEKVLGPAKTTAPKKERRAIVEKIDIEVAKATEAYKIAESNIGKFISFSPFKSLEVLEGKIVGIALNKTNTIIYYTVVESTGVRKCCGALNPSIKFIEEPANFKKQAPKAEAKPKAEKKTAKGKAAAKTEATDLDGNIPGGDLM
jgi:hypothetical protein